MDTYSSKSKPQNKALYTVLGVVASVAVLWLLMRPAAPAPVPVVTKAVAVLSGDSDVGGTVTFEQSTPLGPVSITGNLDNLDPSSKRGFHIHVSGDLSGGCLSAGAHFNPFNKNHGAPGDKDRHVGDLGNIESNEDGAARFTFEDKLISLNGPLSIVGRSVVLHAGTDDLGQGGNEESLKTGNAGARAACGVIGLTA